MARMFKKCPTCNKGEACMINGVGRRCSDCRIYGDNCLLMNSNEDYRVIDTPCYEHREGAYELNDDDPIGW